MNVKLDLTLPWGYNTRRAQVKRAVPTSCGEPNCITFAPSMTLLIVWFSSMLPCPDRVHLHTRGVAGAGVLSMYDKLQQILFGKQVVLDLYALIATDRYYYHSIQGLLWWIWLNELSSSQYILIDLKSSFLLVWRAVY